MPEERSHTSFNELAGDLLNQMLNAEDGTTGRLEIRVGTRKSDQTWPIQSIEPVIDTAGQVGWILYADD